MTCRKGDLIPVVRLDQTDRHPWWACECDQCENDRHLFLGERPPDHVVETAKALYLLKGGKKW